MEPGRNGSEFTSPQKRSSRAVDEGGSQGGILDSPIKARFTSRFFKKLKTVELIQLVPDPCKLIPIRDIKRGINKSTGFVFRVSLLGILKDGTSNFFKFHAMDSTGEIAVLAYEKVREIANSLKINGIYKLENFDARDERKDFPQHTGMDLQVLILADSVLTEFECSDFAKIPFEFIPIEEIFSERHLLNSRIDTIAVIAEVYGVEKTGKFATSKRDIKIVDGPDPENEAVLTIWGDAAEDFNGMPGSPIAIRKALIKEYQGLRLLNSSACTLLWVNPELEDERATSLVGWFQLEQESQDTEN